MNDPSQSDLAMRGLSDLNLMDNALSISLRALLCAEIPTSVQRVTMAVPSTPYGKIVFNAVKYALGVKEWSSAARIDVRRLQLVSQCLIFIEMTPLWNRALQQHGLVVLLFAPLMRRVLEATNKARGRNAAASQRNALSSYMAAALAMCRWINVAELLRQPLRDWHAQERKTLERNARAGRRERQTQQAHSTRMTALDWANRLSIESTYIHFSFSCF